MAARQERSRTSLWEFVRDERQDILDFLRNLTADQWETPSLCAGWRIKDVAAHLLLDEPVQAGMLGRALPLIARGRFTPDLVNAAWIDKTRDWPPTRILTVFAEDGVRRVGTAGHLLGPAVALRALVIHHQDMRRPLGIERTLPPDRAIVTLEALVARKGTISIGSRRRASGLRLHAVDVDWAHGDGRVVSGPGEAIIMALAGRRVALDDLDGEGKLPLIARLSAATTRAERN